MPPEITDEFQVARQRAAEQAQAGLQQRKDALAKRYAALGNMNSGSRVKQEQIAEQEVSQGLRDQNQNIDVSQQAELRRQRERGEDRTFASTEAEKGRSFQTSERLGGQTYGADQAALARRYSTGEREAGQKFASGEALKQRTYATGEREAGQKYASGERLAGQQFAAGESALGREQQADQFGQQIALSRDQMAQALEQFSKTFGLEKEAQAFNVQQQIKASKTPSGGLMGQVARRFSSKTIDNRTR